jgi:putative FmdB family regulatory protein
MPLYEYECDACGGRFEVIQKFSETSTECRRCGKGPVRRLVAAPAFQFKGTGWYVTDYAQKGKPGGESSSGSGKSGSGDAGKSDGSGGESKGDGKKADAGTAAAAPSTASKD